MKTKPTKFTDINNPNTLHRSYTAVENWRSMGRVKLTLTCPFCSAEVPAYLWSLSGGGKRCDCGALFGSRGVAHKLTNPGANDMTRKTVRETMANAQVPKPAQVEKPANHNDQFRVLSYKLDGTKVEVYILKPGDWFEGFGGSRHALQVSKTHSLILRTTGPCLRDVEYDVHNKEAWAAIFEGYALSMKDPERAK